MAIERFSRRPNSHVAEHETEPMLLVGDMESDFVYLPKELGGHMLRVVDRFEAECPVHKNHTVKHRLLEHNFGVAECDQFYWYRYNGSIRRGKGTDTSKPSGQGDDSVS